MKIIQILFFIFLSQTVFGQSNLSFTKLQMIEDFDSLVSTINRVSPHLLIKKDLWHYDAKKQMNKLRSNIDTVSSDLSYYIILQSVLNLAQDMHTSFINQETEWALKQYNEFRSQRNNFKLSLSNVYRDGAYFIKDPFALQGDTIHIGTQITHIEGEKIHVYIKKRLKSTHGITYDLKNKVFYYPGFFRNNETIFKGRISITFKGVDASSKTYLIPTKIFTNYLPSYEYRDTTRVEFWENEKIIYIRLTSMDRKFTPLINNRLNAVKKEVHYYDKIIIDIRDNSGGEDTVWQSLFAELIAKPFNYPLKIDDYKNTIMTKEKIESYGIENVKIIKDNDLLPRKYGFYTILETVETIEPSPTSLKFGGKIYLLAENHYSSAGSAVAVASSNQNDNIISVGRKTGYFLGIGFSPEVFTLPNTKLNYRIAPSIEVTNVKKLQDFMHDKIEIEIPYDLKYYQQKFEYNGDPTDKDFLLKYDPFIKAVMER